MITDSRLSAQGYRLPITHHISGIPDPEGGDDVPDVVYGERGDSVPAAVDAERRAALHREVKRHVAGVPLVELKCAVS